MDARERILEAVKWARAQGYKIVRGKWGVYVGMDGYWATVQASMECCPLGALLLQEQPQDVPEMRLDYLDYVAAKLLNQSTKWVNSFINGIDNTPDGHGEGYILAQEISHECF